MESKQAVAEQRSESPADDVLDGAKPMRADARRNRELLVSAARKVFAEHGSGVSMEAIAKHAGVGIGTLYRHFPNRFDIVEAVYRDDVEELVRAAEQTEALEPWEAVEAFFEAFLRYTKTKQVLLNELKQGFEKNPELRSRMPRADRRGLRPRGRTGEGSRGRPPGRQRLRPHATGEPHLHQRQHLGRADAPPHQPRPRRSPRHRSGRGELAPDVTTPPKTGGHLAVPPVSGPSAATAPGTSRDGPVSGRTSASTRRPLTERGRYPEKVVPTAVAPTTGLFSLRLPEDPKNSRVAVVEHAAVGGRQPVAQAVRCGRDAHDGLVELETPSGAFELGVAVVEDTAVGTDQPVALAVGRRCDADDRSVQLACRRSSRRRWRRRS